MKRIIFLLALICSITASAQTRTYSVDGIAKRFSTALGIPVKASSFYNASSDTAIIFFDPSDTTTLHFKYKGIAKKLAASQIPWDSITGKPSNFATTYLLSNDVKDSIQARVRYVDTASLFANRLKISDTASMLVSRLKISDTASMLANRLKISDTSQILDKTVRTFGNQTGIIGDKSFTNNLTANSFIKSSGTSDQLLQGDGGVQSKADIHSGAFTFDTTGRLLTIPVLGGGSYSVLIPRGTASGAEGITALTSSRTGNLVTVFGDNGSSTTFSARDADSASLIRTSDTATMLSNRLKISDTLTMLSNRLKISDTSSMLSNYRRTTTKITNSDLANSTISGVSLGSNLAYLMNGYGISGMGYNGAGTQTFRIDTSEISTKANVTGLLVGYASTASVSGKLNISDTAAMLSNLLRKTDTATMLSPFVQYSDTSFMLSPYARTSNLPDFSAKVNVSDTASMLSNYRRKTTLIENADLRNSAITINGSSTLLGGAINVGTVNSVGLTAPTGFTVSNSPITSSGNIGLSFTAGYSLPTNTKQGEWDIAYNKRVTSANLSTTQLTLALGDASTVTTSVPTFNQNTTGTALSLSSVLSKTLGGAGDVSGILKANGTGTVSAALAGDITSLISGTYVDLTTNQTIGGNKTLSSFLSFSSPTASLGAGTTNSSWFEANTGTAFNVRISGGDRFRVSSTEAISTVPINGTSLSMSGNIKTSTYLSVGTPTSPFYSEQVTVGIFDNPKITLAATGGYRWSTYVDGNAGDGNYRIRYEDGSIEPLVITRSSETLLAGATPDGTNKLIVNGGVKGTTGTFTGRVNIFGTTMPSVSNPQLLVTTNTADFVVAIRGNVSTGNSYGPIIQAGTNASDIALLIRDANNVTDFFKILGSGAATFSSSVTASGSMYGQGYRFAYSAKSSNYTLTDNDDYITVTNASTITLPTAVGRAGKRYIIRSTAGAGVTSTLATTSSQTVDGAAGSFSFGNGNYNILIVFSDGANWFSEQWITGS